MSEMVLNALRRKLAMYEAAGLMEKAQRTSAQIARYFEPAPETLWIMPETETVYEPLGTVSPGGSFEDYQEAADESAGADMAPAGWPPIGGPALARAEEMGLTPADFVGEEPSGKGGKFLVGDVERIAAARDKP